MNLEIHIAGAIVPWPSKSKMAEILRMARMSVTVSAFSIRIDDCERFVFQEYGSDLGNPCTAFLSTLDLFPHYLEPVWQKAGNFLSAFGRKLISCR